jgi:hypothetical protein
MIVHQPRPVQPRAVGATQRVAHTGWFAPRHCAPRPTGRTPAGSAVSRPRWSPR